MNASAFLRPLACTLLLAAALPLAASAADAPATKAAAQDLKVPVLGRAQVDALLAKPTKILIIDLRRPEEQATKGTFPVYLSVPVDSLEQYLAYIPRDREILTVSNHKGRSGKAADLLLSHGYKVAGVVGAEYYKEQGGKLLTAAPPAAAKP